MTEQRFQKIHERNQRIMENINNTIDIVDEESLAEKRIKDLRTLFPEFFFDDQFDLEGFKAFISNLPQDAVNNSGYGLNWFGKADAIKILRKQSEGTLSPLQKESIDFDNAENIIIKGENLEVMKLIQKSYFGSFKMIYMDPPYNTGDDFIFDDDVDNPLPHYFEVVKQLSNNRATDAKQLQTEIEEDTGVSFAGRIENKRERRPIHLKQDYAIETIPKFV